MSDTTFVITILGALGAVVFAVAPRVSEALVRARARRLPTRIADRMEEEWLGELNAITSRPGKLAFAIALTFTRRQTFAVPGEDSMTETHDRPAGGLGVFSGRKTLLILPTLAFSLAAYGASFLLPVRYASESLILFRPREVPSSLVADPIAASVEDRLKSIEQTVMSRTALHAILRSLPQLKIGRETLNMDRMIGELRNDINVQFPPSSEDANPKYFRIRYVGRDPKLAQEVTSKLTRSFIESNGHTRQAKLNGTRDFLRRQLGVLAERVTETGDELERERATHGPQSGRILAIEYEQLVSTYKATFAKLEDVKMAFALESEQRGDAFVVVDPANLPTTPVAPNRLAIAGLGAVAGLVLGGTALVGLDRRRRRALA